MHTSGLKFHYFRIIRTEGPSRNDAWAKRKTQFSNFTRVLEAHFEETIKVVYINKLVSPYSPA